MHISRFLLTTKSASRLHAYGDDGRSSMGRQILASLLVSTRRIMMRRMLGAVSVIVMMMGIGTLGWAQPASDGSSCDAGDQCSSGCCCTLRSTGPRDICGDVGG